MYKILLKIRILFESLFLYFGGVAFWLIFSMYFYSPVEEKFGQSGGHVFYAILTLFVGAIVIWILTERRKEIGECIATSVYIFLNLLSFFATGLFVMLYIASFD